MVFRASWIDEYWVQKRGLRICKSTKDFRLGSSLGSILAVGLSDGGSVA